MSRPFVSVVVPTRNRAEYLEVCLRSLLAQDYPTDRYEVLVVDDGSTDATPEVVASAMARAAPPELRQWRQPHRGVNAARDTAITNARGQLICLIDDDEQTPSSWLSAVVDGAERFPEAACLGGPMRLLFEGRPPRICGREPLGESELDYGDATCEVKYVWGGNMAVPRWAFERFGLLDDTLLLGGTETEWLQRLHAEGLRARYLPEAWLWHRRVPADLRLHRLVTRHFRRGWGQAINGSRIGRPYEAIRVIRGLRRGLVHAIGARCTTGLLSAALHAGRLVGMIEVRLRRRDRRSPWRDPARGALEPTSGDRPVAVAPRDSGSGPPNQDMDRATG
jgi:glucosyl-dolichyl phosphate glucuronosyltransferase